VGVVRPGPGVWAAGKAFFYLLLIVYMDYLHPEKGGGVFLKGGGQPMI